MSLILAAALAFQAATQQPVPLKNPTSKSEERLKFHVPDLSPMPMSVRLKGWEQRQAMMKDSLFTGIKWRSVGAEFQSGRVIDIEQPTNLPDTLLVAFATGGLYRTTTEGQVWEPLFDDQSAFGIGDIDVSADGKTIWVGSGENNSQRTSYAGTGVFKSVDAGKTWQNMGLHESHHIGRVIIHPKDVNTVYVASLGPLYSQGGERGVYKTTDGGKTWTQLLKIDKYTGVIDLDFDPRSPDILYAAAWDRDRRPWNIREAGPGSAIYKSINGGKTWTKLAGLPAGESMGRVGLAVAPSRPDTVYVFMDGQDGDPDEDMRDERVPSGRLTPRRFRYLSDEALKELDATLLRGFLRPRLPQDADLDKVMSQIKSGELKRDALVEMMLKRDPQTFERRLRDAQVWRSDDAGKTWTCVRDRMGEVGGYYFNRTTVHPKNHLEVYICALPLLKSTDGGSTWTSIAQRNHVDRHCFFIDPTRPNRMVDGNDGGAYISYDSGLTWRHLNNLAVGQYTTIAVDNKIPYNVYGGLQDNGTIKSPSTYRPGFSPVTAANAIGGGDGSWIAVDPRNGGDIVYVASQFGSHSAINQATNERWSTRPAGQGLRFNWISPLIISPHHPDIVYCGSQYLHRSFNQGRRYERISPNLTKDIPNGDVPHSTLTTVSESPLRFGRIYTGADDGSVYTTGDGGVTWEAIPTPRTDRWVTRIVASKWKEGLVYCTQNGYRQDEWTAMVWKSEDHGKTWVSIAGGLPPETVNTVREDPTNDKILYVGTNAGVYASLDKGATWFPYGGGLMNTPVHDLVIQERDGEMVVATHARSAWIVDVKPLQTMTDELLKTALKLTSPDSAFSTSWGYEGRPEWSDAAATEPRLNLRWWTLTAGRTAIKILDKDGKVAKMTEVESVRGFNTGFIGLRLKDEVLAGKTPPKIFKSAAEALLDPHADKRAQFLPKGDYKVVIEVGGQTAETTWSIS